MLLERALMLKNIRAFFDGRDVIEVETPLLSKYATTDPHLESLSSRFREQNYYLNTSPEYAMKRLLASSKQAIYQICKAFRDDELGANHNPEFSMLEWYRPGYDDMQLMQELAALVTALLDAAGLDAIGLDAAGLDAIGLDDTETGPARKIEFTYKSYQQAFEEAIGLNPHQTTTDECYRLAVAHRVEIPQGLTIADAVDDWLDWLLTQTVLPAFNKDGFTFLYDYPASQCALARIERNEQQVVVAKRFELFFGEIELANGFHELTDADEQLSRFQQENKVRLQSGLRAVEIDENFIAALRHGLPECAGVALGLDRLLMVITGSNHIDQVLTFAWENS